MDDRWVKTRVYIEWRMAGEMSDGLGWELHGYGMGWPLEVASEYLVLGSCGPVYASVRRLRVANGNEKVCVETK